MDINKAGARNALKKMLFIFLSEFVWSEQQNACNLRIEETHAYSIYKLVSNI